MQQIPPIPSDVLREIVSCLSTGSALCDTLYLSSEPIAQLLSAEIDFRIASARQKLTTLTGSWLSLASELDSAIQEASQAGRIDPIVQSILLNGSARVSGEGVLAISERVYNLQVETIDRMSALGIWDSRSTRPDIRNGHHSRVAGIGPSYVGGERDLSMFSAYSLPEVA